MIVEFKIGEKDRGFSFGLNTIKIITDLTGIKPIEDIFSKFKENDLMFLRTFFYACALHYAKSKKVEIDFEEFDVSDWLDELGLPKAMEIMGELLKTYTLKNHQAPDMAGLIDLQ